MWLSVSDHLGLLLASLGVFYGDRIPLHILYKMYAFVFIKAFHSHFSYLKKTLFQFSLTLRKYLNKSDPVFFYITIAQN